MKEMATKQPESVIANLMGIDEQPPHQKPFCKHQRVLSDSYIRKSASVGLRQGSSVCIRRSSRMYDEMSPAVKSVPGVQMSKNKHEFSLKKFSNSTTSKIQMGIRSQETGDASVSELSSGVSGKGKNYASRYVLRYPQKLEYDSVPVYRIRLEKTSSDRLSTGFSVFGQTSMKTSDDVGDFKLELHSKSEGRELNQSLRPESEKLHHELTHRKRVVKSILSPGRSCVAHNQMLDIISQQVRIGRNFGDLSRSGYMGKNYVRSKPVGLFSKKLDESTFRHKSKNQKIAVEEIFEPMKVKGLGQFQFSPGMSSKTSALSSYCFSCSDSENNKPQAKVQGIQDEMGDGCVETELSSRVPKSTNSNPASEYAFEDTLANSESFNTDGISADQQSESNPVHLSIEDGHSSCYVQEALSGETSLKEFSNEKSAYLDFSDIEYSQFQGYLEETNQQSSNSVLEPFDSQNPSTIEGFKSLLLQLQDLDFELVETCSEGSVIVSDDDDSTEGFLDISRNNDNAIQWWSGNIESRNFSYMVDVLDEAGFYSKKSFTDFKTWNSLEFPICPLVFKSLEKKYGKQTYWLMSERHLLFDRVNSALLNILNPILNYQASEISIQKWFIESWRRDKIEDELWDLLLNEENGNLSEKAVRRGMKWLELEEDLGIICGEMEKYLLDELVMELVGLWD